MYNKMTSVKTYSVSNKIQLIDINHDMINFKVEFVLSSDKPFYALIVDQDTLDNTEIQNIEFRYVENNISGEVVSDKNTYQNYYVVLRSDTPTEVRVQLITTPLPEYLEQEEDQYPQQPQQPQKQHPQSSQQTQQPRLEETVKTDKTDNASMLSFKNIVLLILIIAVLLGLYYYYSKKSSASKDGIRTSLLTRMEQAQ